MKLKFRKALLIIGDIVILYASLYISLLLRYNQHPSKEYLMAHIYPFSLIFLFWIIIFYVSDLYNINFAVSNRSFFRRAIRSFILGGLFSAIFFYLMPGIRIAPKTNLILFVIIYTILFFLWRSFFNWSIKSYIPKDVIGIIGYNNQVKNLLYEFKKKPHLGFEIAFILKLPDQHIETEFNAAIIDQNEADVKRIIQDKHVSTLILATNPADSESLSNLLFSCLNLKVNFINLSHFYEEITDKVPLDLINKTWFLENLSEGNKSVYDLTKRLIDFLFAVIFLIITLPIQFIIGILIKISSKGQIFFVQERIGQSDVIFKMIKFRSMKDEGNNFQPTEINDNRITKIGSILRKTRLDELPQLINILRGEMSFVGPRPERPELVENLEKQIPFYNERMLVKPGLTGWDQVSQKYHSPSYEDTMEKLQYDLFYVKNRSFYLDFSIILKTMSTVLSRSGR